MGSKTNIVERLGMMRRKQEEKRPQKNSEVNKYKNQEERMRKSRKLWAKKVLQK